MLEVRPPLSVLLIDELAQRESLIRDAFGSGYDLRLQRVADLDACAAAVARDPPDLILYAAAPGDGGGQAGLAHVRCHCPEVPIVCLSGGARPLPAAGDAQEFSAWVELDQLPRLAAIAERALVLAEQNRLRRRAHAQDLLTAHHRAVRQAATISELLANTCNLPLGADWTAIAIAQLAADGSLADTAPGVGVFTGNGQPPPDAGLAQLMARAAAAGAAGWLRDQGAQATAFALPIGSPAWAVLGLVSAAGRPAEEDLEALATVAADIDHAREFLTTRAQVEYRALHNPTTGYPNGLAFRRALTPRIERGPMLVALVDIDRFRQFNDSRSRRYGDSLLTEVGARLRGLLPPDALFGHPQDDDFLIAFDFAEPPANAVARIAALVNAACAEPFLVEGEAVSAGMHASVLVAPDQADTAEEIESSLAAVLAEAPLSGQLVLAVTEETRLLAPLRAELARDLRGAVALRQFELFLQPKFDAMSRSLSGAEALIRWRHPARGLVSPAMFIPLLEDSGLIIEVGAWVRGEGLAIWQRWRDLGFGHLRLAVNVSSRELRHASFVSGCEALLAPMAGHHGLDIEITESMLMVDVERNVHVLHSLRELGCKIAIDDFGTGYSSLNYLSRLPADTLKVDQSFTAALVSNADTLSMVTNIIGLAHSLGLSVVAEGVEQEEQAKLLRLLRCDELQGYLLGRPLPAGEFERVLLARPAAGAQAVPARKRGQTRRGNGERPNSDGAAAAADPSAAPARMPWLLAGAAIALLLVLALAWWWPRPAAEAARGDAVAAAAPAGGATIDSIAVLPFADHSRGHENEYLAEGLSEELIDRLTRIPQLRVIARGSAFSFKGKAGDASAIAHALGVSSLLSGQLRRNGPRLYLDVELLTPDGVLLWSQHYQRPMSELLLVEDEVARGVVAALRLKLLPEQEQALAKRTVTNPEAFNQYLLGRNFFRQSTPESFQLSRSALEISTALDPGFAPAWAELANTVSYLADTSESAAEVAAGQARARELADKAVALDPQSAAGYRVRAGLRSLAFDFQGAMRDTIQALRLNGGDSDNQRRYALLLLSQGRLDEALLAATRAAELDPLSANAYVVLGMIHNAEDEPDAAIASLDKALSATPGHGFAQGNLVQAWLLKGDATQALAVARQMKPGLWQTFAFALTHYSLRDRAEADAALQELVRNYADGAAYQIAEAYAWRGETATAFAWLQRAYRQHDGGLEQIKNDPLLRNLRADPRFALLVTKLKLPD